MNDFCEETMNGVKAIVAKNRIHRKTNMKSNATVIYQLKVDHLIYENNSAWISKILGNLIIFLPRGSLIYFVNFRIFYLTDSKFGDSPITKREKDVGAYALGIFKTKIEKRPIGKSRELPFLRIWNFKGPHRIFHKKKLSSRLLPVWYRRNTTVESLDFLTEHESCLYRMIEKKSKIERGVLGLLNRRQIEKIFVWSYSP